MTVRRGSENRRTEEEDEGSEEDRRTAGRTAAQDRTQGSTMAARKLFIYGGGSEDGRTALHTTYLFMEEDGRTALHTLQEEEEDRRIGRGR